MSRGGCPLNDAPLRTSSILLEPGLRGRSSDPFGHRPGPVRLRTPVPSHGASAWVTGAEGGFLGAVNRAGYLIGVLGGRTLAQRLGTARALDIGMGLAALAFAACAWNGGVRWRPVWGTVVGFGGGGLFGAARARGPGGGSPA